MTRTRPLVGFVLMILLAGCGESEEASTFQSPSSVPPWVEEAELLADPSLRVTPRQVVLLHLAGTQAGAARIRHTIPYRFEDTTTYQFCIPADEPYIRSAELFASGAAASLFQVVPGDDCVTRTIEPGAYRLVVEHDGSGISDTGTRAFIHVPRLKDEPQSAGAALAQGSTSPGGLVVCDALAVLTTADGKYIVGGSGSPYPTVSTAASVDLASGGWQVCRDVNGAYEIYLTGAKPQALENNTFGSYAMYTEADGRLTIHDSSVSPYASPLELTDLGDFQFLLSTAVFTNGQATPSNPIVIASDGTLRWTTSGASPVYGMPVKYYLPGVTPPPLQMGEVALYQGCNFSTAHGTWVVRGNLPNVSGGYVSPNTFNGIYYNNPEKGTREFFNYSCCSQVSARTGPQTVGSFYGGVGYASLIENVGEDTDCNGGLEEFNSVKVTAARDFIIATNYCRNCNLTGIDLSGLDLTKGLFPGSTFTAANLAATNLTKANLSTANLPGPDIVLAGASFTDANLTSTSFRGADLSGSSAHSTNGLVVSDGIANRPDLTGATIDVDTFLPPDWRYLNLTGATIENVAGATLSSSTSPVNFSAALMNSVDLHGALLDGANFGCDTDPVSGAPVCAQLIDVNLNRASLKKASLVNADLQGVNLDFANLDSANLCSAKLNLSPDLQKSASLQGAYLRNVNLYQADLTGANLANSNFYSTSTSGICNGASCTATKCATAGNATLNSATFSQAYLSGTDFSDASCKGVDFSRAFLLGASFTNANLSGDNNTGRTTNFRQASLQGANLSMANSVTNANFDGASIDTRSASATVKLESANTMFVGFTPNPPSAAGCVQFTYPHASATPRTDSSNTCPNGSTGACSASSQWVLPTPTPGCSAIDFNWGVAPQ